MEHRSKELFDTTMPRIGPSRKGWGAGPWGVVLLVALVGLAVAGVLAAVGPLAPQRPVARHPGVATVVRADHARKTLALRGTLVPLDQGVLTAPEAGTVTRIAVRTGEVVTRGQVLAVVEARELVDEVRTQTLALGAEDDRVRVLNQERDLRAQKAVQEAAARGRDLARLETLVAEQTDLVARGLASPRDLRDQVWARDQAREADARARIDEGLARLRVEADLAGALRAREAAETQVRTLGARLEACVVRSPDDLLVLGTDQARTGAPVARYQTLVTYALLTRAEARFSVPGYAASHLEVGSALEVTLGDRTYRARVTHKSQVSEDRSSDTTVAALLDTLPNPLMAGQGALATVGLGTVDQPLTLPPGAWVGSGRMEWVYRISADGTRAIKTPVRLSSDYDQVIVVLGGLEEDDRIITDAYEEFGGAPTLDIEGDDHAGTQGHH